MKISKESHRKTGVGVHAEQGITGLLYKDPLTEVETIEDIVCHRADSTKRLFSLFSNGEKTRGITVDAKYVAKVVNSTIGSLKGNPKKGRPERLTTDLAVQQLIKSINYQRKNYTYSKEAVDEALDRLLKKSFRQPKPKAALRLLLMRLLVEEYKRFSEEELQQIKEDFIKQLVEEYNKESIKKQIPTAIRNQNMVVQPTKDKGILAIAETPNSKSTKRSEKDAFRQFLMDYAVLDDYVRHQYRMILRRLVDLYFYGETAVIPGEFDEWQIHEERKKKTDIFANKVVKTIKNKKGFETEIIDVDVTADVIRQANMKAFREAKAYIENCPACLFDNQSLNMFWIHHISSEVERIYSHLNAKTGDYKFQVGYLSEKTWKGIINYLSIKYIAEGKAVYNYAMSALASTEGEKIFGKLDDKYINGISSFEYEKIKAEESLQRECAVNVVFAANHLSNATVDLDEKNTDFLLLKNYEPDKNQKGKGVKSLAECASGKPNTLRNILQFFGGASVWRNFDFGDCDGINLLDDIKEMIYSLRNASFHYNTENAGKTAKQNELIQCMFAYECDRVNTVQKNKMYTNNVPLFYQEDDIERFLYDLYSEVHGRSSQVPAFNTIMVRRKLPVYLKEMNVELEGDDEVILKWQNAVYYLLKEIYYNRFLTDQESFDLLQKYVEDLDERCEDKHLAAANRSFKEVFRLYSADKSLSTTCQMIMMEYNNQNKCNRAVSSDNERNSDKPIFQHYKMILFAGLRCAFIEYIKKHEDVYGFIFKPAIQETILAEEEFLPSFRTNQYVDLIERIHNNQELLNWYVVGRLLTPKQVSMLVGSFRSYVQYVNDVARRARQMKNPLVNDSISLDVDHVIQVLDVCTELNGNTSNVLEDYFDDKEDYAQYIGKFVAFGTDDAALSKFCSKEIGDAKVGLYHDGTNPILNRNVVHCKLYGATNVLANAKIQCVTDETIQEFFNTAGLVKDYLTSGTSKMKEDVINLKKYRALKNMVELRNIVEYSEILNELQGQLINWGYLRERDLMYFQLGFHYLCLQNSSPKPVGYNVAGPNTGTILYQIVAMYTNGLPMLDDGGARKSNTATISAGSKISAFIKYAGQTTYLAGLELFENIEEHDQCISLRDSIEHFHYYAKQERSLLDIYSEVFDRFFTYDMKYAKGVPNMLSNILLRHLVVPSFTFSTGEKLVGERNEEVTKPCAKITLKDKAGLASEKHTYMIGEDKIQLCARNNTYLSDVAAILYYPECAPAEVVRDTIADDARTYVKSRKKSDGNRRPKKDCRKDGRNYKKN